MACPDHVTTTGTSTPCGGGKCRHRIEPGSAARHAPTRRESRRGTLSGGMGYPGAQPISLARWRARITLQPRGRARHAAEASVDIELNRVPPHAMPQREENRVGVRCRAEWVTLVRNQSLSPDGVPGSRYNHGDEHAMRRRQVSTSN